MIDPIIEKSVRATAYMATGLAILMREGISPNQAEKVLLPALAGMGEIGVDLADFIRTFILPEVVRATMDYNQLIARLKKGDTDD